MSTEASAHTEIKDAEQSGKIKSGIISRMEESSSKGFALQMILTTLLTYIAVISINNVVDLLVFNTIEGNIHFLGFIRILLSSALVMFVPVAILSSMLIMFLSAPIMKLLVKKERGNQISDDEFFRAKDRTDRIPMIIFIVNILIPLITHVILRIISGSENIEGIMSLIRTISVFLLGGQAQNAIYQRILMKPRAMLRTYSVDEKSRNWFARNLDRMGFYISAVFVCATLMYSSVTLIDGSLSAVRDAASGEAAESMLNSDSLSKMRSAMNSGEAAQGDAAENGFRQGGTQARKRIAGLFSSLIILMFSSITVVELISTRTRKTQTRILRNLLEEMAGGSGDLTARVVIVQADDTGILADKLNRVLDRLQTMFRHISEQTELVAESSRAVSAVLEGTVAATEEMTASVSQINSNTARNRRVVADSREALSGMLKSLEQITENVNTQAAHVEQTSSAMTEMIANIQSVNDVTMKANDLSKALKNVSSDGGQAVSNSITAVKDIEESSNEVNSLVQIISRILAATNMLAMNAAIEAAHAGDAGRGFAVVAEEVRNLADDSSSNLKTISDNIRDVIEKVNRGVELSEAAGNALQEIGDKTEQTTMLMSEVSSAMQEQSSGANEVLNSVTSLVEASATINRLSEEQHKNNDIMKENLENTVNAFTEVQSATAELELGNREILDGIEELKDVIRNNEHVVDALQQELKGFKI